MKFLFVVRQLAPGGAELATQLLGRSLQGRGHQIHILCLGDFSADDAALWQPWAQVSAIDKHWLRQFTPAADEQLVLVDGIGHRHAPRKHAISIIHSDCNARFRARKGLIGKVRNRIEARRRYPGREILVSRAMADELSRWSGRTHPVIPNPFDADTVRRLANEQGCEVPTPYLLHIGRISAEKRQDRLIRTYAATPQLQQHRLVFVGKEQDETKPGIPALQALAAGLGVANKVLFTGNLYNPFPLLKQAACLILCSDSETMGYVLLEAMALDIPMVSTATTGGKEVLGNSFPGLVQCNAQLGSTIAAALASPQRFKKSLPADYDVDAVTDAFEHLVENLRS